MYRTLAALRAVVVSALVSTSACAPVEPSASPSDSSDASVDGTMDSIPKYSSLYTLEYSILREYDRAAKTQGSRIRYPVCVSAEFSVTSTERQNFLKLEENAINTWNKVLIGQSGWKVDNISLYMVGGASPSSCPSTDNGLKVYKLVGLADRDRGYAEFQSYKNAIGRAEWKTADVKRELHEYGHQLGLGDTYTEAGYQTPQGQPAGIMNLFHNVSTLTADDIAGIRQIWYMIRTGSSNPCGTGYTSGTASQNNNNHRFCVALNGTGTPPGSGTCTDKNTYCRDWAAKGECTKNPVTMSNECCASCKSGGGGGTTCTDKSTHCGAWAAKGECTTNPITMSNECCASCKSGGGGGTTCTDKSTYCRDWAAKGECTKNPVTMSNECCASCKSGGGGGTTCRDSDTNCSNWAKSGECTKNPSFMRTSCCASCAGK